MNDPLAPLADKIHRAFGGLRSLGLREAQAMSEQELKGTAHMLACALSLRRWQLRHERPSWDELSRAWESLARPSREPSLCAELHRDDRHALVTDNAESFALRERWIAGAQRTVDLATYYLQGDETGRATVAQLVAAKRRGVRVRVIADHYALSKKQYEGLGADSLVETLLSEGVEVRRWTDRSRPFDVNHRKLLLIDDRALLIGGRNIADHYAGPLWRDVELALEGPSAAQARALFDRTWRNEPEPTLAPGALLYASAPGAIRAHSYWVYLLECIARAKRSIQIENAYLFAHPALRRALAAAVRRGVRAQVLTNSDASNDLGYANYRLYKGLGALFDAGVEVHVRKGAGRTLHCKYFVVDDRWVGIGSSNLDYYSARFCTEANVHAQSEALAGDCARWFEEGVGDAATIDGRSEITATIERHARIGRIVDALLEDTQ
ncbi:MAG: phosphatidylserine/phosphatidylglycerophosphate/cardiolipin synthase family protein [Polyangiales bacterium]